MKRKQSRQEEVARSTGEPVDGDASVGRREYLKYTGALAVAPLAKYSPGADKIDSESSESTGGSIEPTDLRVEYEENPNNIYWYEADSDARSNFPPRLTWEVTGSHSATQSAYRVVVDRTEEALDQNNGEVWDSGKVGTDQSINNLYDGESLEPDSTYHWKVQIWDEEGTESGWSPPATFTTAIPYTSQYWEGDWIGPHYGEWDSDDAIDYDYIEQDDYDDRPEPLLRREFDIREDIEAARLHVSGLGCYELFLNNERVGDRVLEPAQTQYDDTALYSTYDITEYIEQGTNAIAARLGRLRLGEMVADNGDWGWSDVPWWSDPQLLVQLNIEFADGTSTSVVTDDDWLLTEGPTLFDSLFSGEVYDARKEKAGWKEVGYDDSDWKSPTITDNPPYELHPQRVQPMQVRDTIDPETISEVEDGVYVFDFGRILTGWSELTVSGEEGTEITLTHGEKLNDDGTVDNSNFLVAAPMQRDYYILSSEGTETWESRYSYKGFRYVQIEGYPGEPDSDTLEAKYVYTTIDEDVESEFSSSNDLLNQIHENTQRAYRNNMQGVPTDTPTYEKNGWSGDAQLTAETGIYNYDMARFWEKWIRDFDDAQRESGETSVVVPHNTKYSFVEYEPNFDAVQGPTPGWDAAFIFIPWWSYQYYGDTRLIETYYDSWKQYIDWIQQWSEGEILSDFPENISEQEEAVRRYRDSHILPVGLGDWGGAPLTNTEEDYGGSGNEVAITSTAYYFRFTEILSEAASLMGREDEADQWSNLSSDILADFNDEFFDEDVGYYRTGDESDYLQTSNVFPLAFDMVPEEHKNEVIDNLVEDITEKWDGHLNTATLGTKYILSVLSDNGHHDVAYTIATQTDYPSWGSWIVNGRTSLLEFWELDSRSWNHHFLGMIDEWFYKYLAGIQVDEPGFEHIKISPTPVDDLRSAEGQVSTIRGEVVSDWEVLDVEDGTMALHVSIPGNTTATIEIPTLGNDEVEVQENGKSVWKNGTSEQRRGVKTVEHSDDRIIIEVDSGEYHFVTVT